MKSETMVSHWLHGTAITSRQSVARLRKGSGHRGVWLSIGHRGGWQHKASGQQGKRDNGERSLVIGIQPARSRGIADMHGHRYFLGSFTIACCPVPADAPPTIRGRVVDLLLFAQG